MIDVGYKGGLGNILFQYCFGRILATRLGYKLNASPIKGFSSSKKIVGGESYVDNEVILEGQIVDIDALILNKPKSHIICDGHFQRLSYYEKYYSDIKTDWLVLDEEYRKEKKDLNDVVLHIRRGDFVWKGITENLISFSFYENILENYVKEWRNLYICTDSPDDPFIKQFQKYDAIIHSNFKGEDTWRHVSPGQSTDETLNDFSFIMSFNRIVLSPSTFSWWASFLSDASEVYYPIIGDFDKSRQHENYFVLDEERSIFCEEK